MAPSAATRASAVLAGLVLDRAFSASLARFHPVAGYGKAMVAIEQRMWAPSRIAGVAYTAVGLSPAVVASLLGRLARGHHKGFSAGSWLSLALASWVASGASSLWGEAEAMARLLKEADLEAARARLGNLAGRDAGSLDSSGISRAVIESVAENTVDAAVASVFWALCAGVPGVVAHRCINTLDAMVGHRNQRYGRFGWASARLDDLAAWIPARLLVVLVMALRPNRAGEIWRLWHGPARLHPSPNAGVSEASFAAALGVRLGGANTYGGILDDRPKMGNGRTPSPGDIQGAVSLSAAALGVLALGAALVGLTTTMAGH